jgi:hypothetical protein
VSWFRCWRCVLGCAKPFPPVSPCLSALLSSSGGDLQGRGAGPSPGIFPGMFQCCPAHGRVTGMRALAVDFGDLEV